MPNLVPLRLDISPLPPDFVGTPQQLFDALEARATVVTDQAYSLFVVGPVAPTTDQGPFFLNGITPYGWDTGTGSYIPMVLAAGSLRYGIFPTGGLPADNTTYDVVFEINPGSSPAGAPLNIDLFYNGAWTPFPWVTQATLNANYYTQAQVNTIVGGGSVSYPARGDSNVVQSGVPVNNTEVLMTLPSATINPSGAFDTAASKYTAPVSGIYEVSVYGQIDNATAVANDLEIGFNLWLNGSTWPGTGTGPRGGKMTTGQRCWPQFTILVPLTAGDYIQLVAQGYDGIGTGTVDVSAVRFSVHLVLKI